MVYKHPKHPAILVTSLQKKKKKKNLFVKFTTITITTEKKIH